MTKYSRIGREEKPAAAATLDEYGQSMPPDPASIIKHGLYAWQAQCRRPLPEPCPRDFDECVAWWREQMQEPEYRGETKIRSGGAGTDQAPNWDCGYAVRVRSSLLRFLALTEQERKFVVGARQDGIFYRGESMAHFADIAEETMRQKEIGAEAYRRTGVTAMTHAIASMTGKPSNHGQESLSGRDRPPVGSAEWYAEKTGEPLAPLMSTSTDNRETA